jgi:hypothetical protein
MDLEHLRYFTKEEESSAERKLSYHAGSKM